MNIRQLQTCESMSAEADRRRTLLTLEERLALAAGSQAASPETAARLVQRLSEVHTVDFFCGKANLDSMAELTGEFLKCMGDELLHYGGFCQSFQMAIVHHDDLLRHFHPQIAMDLSKDPYRPTFGVRVNNALVLLGEILLEHVKGEMPHKDIYHSTRMTLEQYLDALVDLSFREDGTLDRSRAETFHSWRTALLKDYDGSKPLGEALADILRRYIAAWQEFDHLDYILRCMGALTCYLEENREGNATDSLTEPARSDLEGSDLVEEDKRYLDPYGYYFTLANEYPEDAPDPDDEPDPDDLGLTCEALRSQIFLSERDYHPETLSALAAQSPSPDMRALLEKYISEERLASAMQELNTAVADLYMLWVAPYLRLEEYHYEGHM